MVQIILPDSEKAKFEYTEVVTPKGMKIAMVKFPASLKEPFEADLFENKNSKLMWFLTQRRDEIDDGGENEASRYELRGAIFDPTTIDIDPETFDPDKFVEDLEADSLKDGYVYFPKALRDGRHDDRYILQPIKEVHFTTRTERGMFEEVAWSPFGTIAEATKQEAQNLERNPLMRNWI